VSVENLSKFGAAAKDSGSSVEEVSKAMGKLARGVVDPASKANEALKSIGISSTDAQGKIRGMDQIMLDLADKFQKMPDGAQKTALAMELFGKSWRQPDPNAESGAACA
jgi:TP901 family phage tail tape measure protein